MQCSPRRGENNKIRLLIVIRGVLQFRTYVGGGIRSYLLRCQLRKMEGKWSSSILKTENCIDEIRTGRAEVLDLYPHRLVEHARVPLDQV